jgi:DNA-binding transcriptional ArsR family regulator
MTSSENRRVLVTEAEIGAYLHRTRMAILGALRGGPATGSQIAAALGVHPANLTRHLRVLEEAGLIALVEKRDTGRNLEKYYRAAASQFDVAPGARLDSPQGMALAFVRSDLSSALQELPARDPRPVLALLRAARLRPRDLARFRRAIEDLVEDFASADAEGGEPYHLNLSLYPGAMPAPDQPEIRLHRKRRTS